MPETPALPWLVLGAGISGLLAGWHLQRQGFEVEVWEAEAKPGGLARTLPWPGPEGGAGYLERGPQALLVARGSAMASLLADLGVATRSPGSKGPRWLGKGGRLHPSPASLAGLFQAPGLTFQEKLRILGEPFIRPGSGTEETLHAFFKRRLGEGFARELLPALVAGVLAAPADRVGMDAMPRLRALEARGGLLRGGLVLGAEHTRLPAGGTGALAEALARGLDHLHTGCAARTLEPLPAGGWRVCGDGLEREAAQVVLALPAADASRILRPLSPGPSAELEAIPCLDLSVWHSRHPVVPGWERGMGLQIHPPDGRGVLGVISLALDDPRGAPGLMQLRTYVGGAYPMDPTLGAWPGVFGELRRWLPVLPEAVQVRAEHTPRAFPLLGLGHGDRSRRIVEELPPGLHWLGASRFGPSLKDLAEGVRAWASDQAVPLRPPQGSASLEASI
jgi:oxygen-dependent protoporphyrinogen oxidase